MAANQETVARLRTAQSRFVHWFGSVTSAGADAALVLWCKLNSLVESNKSLANLEIRASSAADLSASYERVEYGIAKQASNFVAPVLTALGAGFLTLVLAESAVLAAAVALVVFLVMLLRNGGSIDSASEWMNDKLSGLKALGN